MILLLLLLFGPAVILFIIGVVFSKKGDMKKAKIMFILAGVYLLISLGACGVMIANFRIH